MSSIDIPQRVLLGRGRRDGSRVLSPQAVEAITAPHRVGMYDNTFRHTMDWGLGFLINSARYGPGPAPYGYGPHASPRTFGHGFSQCATAFADPERALAVAIVWNGRPGEARHDQRLRETLTALYEDLRLTA
jgi:CubicO group peptidase (beta-lactamase class C family)